MKIKKYAPESEKVVACRHSIRSILLVHRTKQTLDTTIALLSQIPTARTRCCERVKYYSPQSPIVCNVHLYKCEEKLLQCNFVFFCFCVLVQLVLPLQVFSLRCIFSFQLFHESFYRLDIPTMQHACTKTFSFLCLCLYACFSVIKSFIIVFARSFVRSSVLSVSHTTKKHRTKCENFIFWVRERPIY